MITRIIQGSSVEDSVILFRVHEEQYTQQDGADPVSGRVPSVYKEMGIQHFHQGWIPTAI